MVINYGKENLKISKRFFSQSRPTISIKESLKNSHPYKWSKNILSGKSKVEIVLVKDNG